jgi:glycosyltransferase involved in cell wall biosynthesis
VDTVAPPARLHDVHIALVVPGGVDRGGRERVIPALLWLIEGLAADHRVTVVALGQERQATRYPLLGATVVNVPPEDRGPHRLARQVVRAVRAVGSDGRPDVVHGLWASVSGLAAVLAGRRYRVPSLVHVAGGELVSLPEIGYGGAQGRGGRLIATYALRRADDITVASIWMAEHVVSLGHRRPAVVPLGVDVERFVPSLVPADPHRLVHVASLNRVKDQTTLLHAIALARQQIPTVSIDFIGVDTLNGEMHRLAAQLGLAESAHFHNFVPSDELASHYQRAAVHVISSRHEAGPVSVAEAAACGVPTVGTRVGHIADLAAATPAGAIAVPVQDARALARAIVATMSDPARRHAMGDAARAWALANDSTAMVRSFTERYERLVASR